MDISNTLSIIIFIIMIILLYFAYGAIKWIISISIIGLIVFFVYKIIRNQNLNFSNISNFSNTYKIKKVNNFIYEIDNFLEPEKCKELIKKYDKELERSYVLTSEKYSKDRTSNQKWITKSQEYDLNIKVLNLINKFTKLFNKNLGNVNLSNCEDFQFAKYEPNQEYKGHYDVCDIDKCNSEHKSECKLDYENMGSYRYMTVIIYLNDDFNEGETYFNKLNTKIKPKTGKALVFFSCELDNDSLVNGKCKRIEESMHAGLKVKNGKKYILTKWVRIKEIN